MPQDESDTTPVPANDNLAAVVAGLMREIDRLKENLETQRLLNHPQRARLIQDLITQIDERQDQLELLQNVQPKQP